MGRADQLLLLGTIVGAGAAIALALRQKPVAPPPPPPPPPSDTPVPLMDMVGSTYYGFTGLLYPGSNAVPAAHHAAGLSFADQVQPRDFLGNPSANGKIGVMAVGYSNIENFWAKYDLPDLFPKALHATAESFIGQANEHQAVDHKNIVFACAAGPGKDSLNWDDPNDLTYDFTQSKELMPLGLTEAQIQVIWLGGAIATPNSTYGYVTLAESISGGGVPYAEALTAALGRTLRTIRLRYPNCKLVFLSNVSYTGYSTKSSTLQPEPYAYEASFGHKWVLEAQIIQMSGEKVDPLAGDLNYNTTAPWVGWALDLWANDGIPRSDGFFWEPGDFQVDQDGTIGVHPGPNGVWKVGGRLLDFFLTSPYTSSWFTT